MEFLIDLPNWAQAFLALMPLQLYLLVKTIGGQRRIADTLCRLNAQRLDAYTWAGNRHLDLWTAVDRLSKEKANVVVGGGPVPYSTQEPPFDIHHSPRGDWTFWKANPNLAEFADYALKGRADALGRLAEIKENGMKEPNVPIYSKDGETFVKLSVLDTDTVTLSVLPEDAALMLHVNLDAAAVRAMLKRLTEILDE